MVAVRDWAAAWFNGHGPRLRFCVRMTAAALLAFALARVVTIPLHGLWAVLTAVVVTQLSVGGSLRATAEYVVGTLGGVVYATIIGLLIAQATAVSAAAALALTVAPLAYAAAASPAFRVAPFTAILVLLISAQLGEGPIESGFYRLLEVALGGVVAVAVSVLLFPERAHGLGLNAAARILDDLARVLSDLLAGFTRPLDLVELSRSQNELGRAVADFHTIAAEAQGERLISLVAEPDPAPLSRTLLRLRHDLVMIGRAAAMPLPDGIAGRLAGPLASIAAVAGDFLRASGRALAARSGPPPVAPVEAALKVYDDEIAALRSEGLTRALSSNDLERLFALGFALEQLHQNFADLVRCVQEWARPADSKPQR